MAEKKATEETKKEGKGRKGEGIIAKIKELVNKGETDFDKIAKVSGASANTVKTQFYKLGKKLGTKRGRKGKE